MDSKIVESNKSINIKYSGKKLKPNSIYYWKVKVWVNNDQESEFSDYQKFKTSKELKRHFTSKYFVEKKINSFKEIRKISNQKTLLDLGRVSFGVAKLKLFMIENVTKNLRIS